MRKRRRHNARFRFKVALEAAKGTKTVNKLASEFELHPNQLGILRGSYVERAYEPAQQLTHIRP